MFENTKSYLDKFQKLKIPCMDISVYYKGKPVFREFRGASDEQGTPLNGKEIYNLYSCSKLITCVAAMKLFEQGKLRLQDEVAEYIPAFKDVTVCQNGAVFKPKNKITLLHLFTMTAGLTYETFHPVLEQCKKDTDGKCPTVKAMDYIAKIPLAFEPGEKWRYSFCHDVIAAVVEIVSGKRFGQFVKENIFDVAGTKELTFLFPDERINEICEQYRFENGQYKNVGKNIFNNFKLGSEYESGGAGVIGTVDDYMLVLEALRTGKIISQNTIELMKICRLTEEQRKATWITKGYNYGLGIRVPNTGSERTDYGWGGAAGAYLSIDDVNDISIFYAQHVLSAPNNDLRPDLVETVKLDLGLKADKEDMNGKGSIWA